MKRRDLKEIQDSGFKVPTEYFQNFEDSIMSHVNLKDKISDSGFTLPEGYFDVVEEQILSQVSQKETVKVIPLLNRKVVFYVSGIAAALVLMFSVINFNSGININSIETASIESYLNNEDIYADELLALLNDTEFLDDNLIDISFSDEAIEDYVNDNLELNDLYIE